MAESALVGSLRVVLTANTAEYKAAMSAAAKSTEVFEHALVDAKAKLGPLGANADAVGKQFQRLSTAFSGTKLVQDAQVAAAAIDKVGGASKLTLAELQKWAPILDRAREKARLMGEELPAAFHKTADAVKAQAVHLEAATKQTSAWGGALGSVKSLALGFAAGFTLDRVVMGIGRAVTETIAWGDELADLSDKTGVSTTALQRWDFAAKQTGTTLDTLIGAAQELGKRLADGEKSTAGAVARLGLNLAELKRMAPEQQFETIAEALRRVEDAGEQGAIGADLFGKAWKQVIAPIRTGLKELGDEAERVGAVIDDETIKAMGELSDSWEALKSSGTGLIATVLKPMIPALNDLASAARNAAGAFREDLWGALLRFSGVGAAGPLGMGAMFGQLYRGQVDSPLKPPASPRLALPDPFGLASERVALATVFAPLATSGRGASDALRELEASAKAWSAWNAQERNKTDRGLRDIPFQGVWTPPRLQQVLDLAPGAFAGVDARQMGQIGFSSWGTATGAMGYGGFTPATAGGGGFNWGALGLGGVGAALPYLSQLVTGGSRAGQIGGTVGGSLGGALGSVSSIASALGGFAPFLGPLAGILGGLIGKLFSPSEGRQASQARGQWIAGMGGNEAFNQRFRDAQVRPEEARRLTMTLMSATSRKDVEAAQQAIEAALARNNALLAEQEQIEGRIAGVEAERQQLLDSLKVGYSDVLSIAQKYNLNVQGLGTAINQSGTTANFTAIINDLEALKRAAEQAGGELDWGGALVGMKEEINALVIDAKAMGTAIPENMRPFIDELLRSGQLLDANGEKMTDLGDLNWGPAVETDAQKVNSALEKIDKTLDTLNTTLADLAAALRGDLPSAAQAGATGIENAINGINPRPIVVRVDYEDPGYQGPEQVSPYAKGGVVGVQYRGLGGAILALADRWRPRGTDTVPAMLTPGELVLTLEQQRGLAGAVAAAGVTPDSQGRMGMAGVTEQTVVVVDGRGSKEDVLERIMAALPRKTRQNDRGFRTLMRDALGVA